MDTVEGGRRRVRPRKGSVPVRDEWVKGVRGGNCVRGPSDALERTLTPARTSSAAPGRKRAAPRETRCPADRLACHTRALSAPSRLAGYVGAEAGTQYKTAIYR